MHFTAFDKAAGLPVAMSSPVLSRLPETVLIFSLLVGWVATACLALAIHLWRDTVVLSFAPGSITVSMESKSGEKAVEEVDAEYSGSEISIGFAGNYLQRMLASIPTDDCRIEILDPKSAAVFRPAPEADQLRLLMPRRI